MKIKDMLPAVCVLVASAFVIACAALQNITPDERASVYRARAKTLELECKAYRFDRAAGLVGDVPARARVCGP